MELDLQRFYKINRRVLMWLAFFIVLYLLRQFFAVVFLTFIFGFVMRSVAKFLTTRTRLPYRPAVVIPYLVALSLLALIITTTIPKIVDESLAFSKRVPALLDRVAEAVESGAREYGLDGLLASYLQAGIPEQATQPAVPESTVKQIDESETMPPVPPADVDAEAPEYRIDTTLLKKEIQDMVVKLLPGTLTNQPHASIPDLLGSLIGDVLQVGVQFLLAVLLSFLIVLDYEAIARELQGWQSRTVGKFFQEAAGSVVEFSAVVGWAFQCQLVVALLNATITCLGMFILGIGPLLLLTTIVFLFGLIPVLGVFISSVPIILIAFNDQGLGHAMLALGVIVLVHLLEAYVFNPRIYAARFHLNPVIVLIILLVAHETFGVWGMLLGIPVTHYILNAPKLPGRRWRRDSVEESSDSTPASA